MMCACVGLIYFVEHCRICVQWCILGGDNNISQGAVSGCSQYPHPVSSVEFHGQIVIFSEIVRVFNEFCDKKMCVLMIDVCKN